MHYSNKQILNLSAQQRGLIIWLSSRKLLLRIWTVAYIKSSPTDKNLES